MENVSPATKRKSDDVLDLQLDDEDPIPFEPEGVLGTEHDEDVLTVYTVSGGGASLVLTEESFAPSSRTLHENDLSGILRTGLSYLFRDGVETVRVRSDSDSIARALDGFDDAPAYRYEDVLFTAQLEN
ncbi:hypothetical protein SAMN05421858_2614 [Haladaptatus litoreus]|uniref:Uncharacterized protein n=1 Tax=Haladaptatus litoreus TaxID=553468 RepID=A0A1N7BKL7_9EURY|nr:hypothetical protein SAMN05421858_2614 [Haladaptatus litoreus]